MASTVTQQVSEAQIERLVDEFYKKIRRDNALAPIFDKAIPGDWDPHLAVMRKFWSSVMLTSGRYKGNPVAKHLQLAGMEPQLFDRWLALFRETCDELFEDLAVIDSGLRLAERNVSDPDMVRAFVAGAREGVDRALRLASQLLTFARQRALPTSARTCAARQFGVVFELRGRFIGPHRFPAFCQSPKMPCRSAAIRGCDF